MEIYEKVEEMTGGPWIESRSYEENVDDTSKSSVDGEGFGCHHQRRRLSAVSERLNRQFRTDTNERLTLSHPGVPFR
jgi:hypothetical protein